MSSNYKKLSSNRSAMKMLEKFVLEGFADGAIKQKLLEEFDTDWGLNTIRRQRRALGYVKNANNQVKGSATSETVLSIPPNGIEQEIKPIWFRDQFKKTNMFKTLCKQFDKDEIDIYLDNYGNLCCQFEDIVLSEFFQIDDFLKHRILVNRALIETKDIKEMITLATKWINKNPPRESDSKEDKQDRIQHIRHKEELYKQLKQCNDRYDKLLSEMNMIYKNLNATRRDRLEEIKGGKESFIDIVIAIQNSQQEREKQGKYAAFTRIASDDVLQEFRQKQVFPDGSKEPIILDHKSDLEEDDG